MTQRDGVGREEGGGFRMGKHMYTCGRFILIFGKSNTVMLSLKIKDKRDKAGRKDLKFKKMVRK